MATRPAREAFKHIETSGLPYFTQVRIMVTTVAMAGAMVVVTKMEPSSSTEVAAAPLKPYQPSHRMKTPSAPIGRLCPGNAFTFVTFLPYPLQTYRYGDQALLHRSERKYRRPCGCSWNLRNRENRSGRASRRPMSSVLRSDK